MQTSDYFRWSADPSAFTIDPVSLPFPVAIWGLVLAVIAFFYGVNKITKETEAKDLEPESWKFWALGLGSLIGGQLLFLILPSPTFEQIGPIEPRWYGFLFASSFVVGYILMFRMYTVANRTQEELDKLLTYVIIGTVIGARLGHVIFYEPELYLRYPSEIIAIWHGGLASHGAAVGILLAMYFYVKKVKDMNFLWLADRVVIVVAIGGAFIRTGNFINSEIIGKATELPWAIVFENAQSLSAVEQMIPRHPTMLYEALLCIVIFAILWYIYKKYSEQPPKGAIFGIFLILLFGGRFFLEFTKINQAAFTTDWTLNMGQWLSIPLVAIGIWLLRKKVRWNKPRTSG